MNREERIWTPETMIHYPLIEAVDLAPDGREVVYMIREPVLGEEPSRFVTHLYRQRLGREPLRLTYGERSNRLPRWSPDGRHIAFLSDRRGDKADLYVMRVEGGEPWPLTKAAKGVTHFTWSPDGRYLALAMAPADPDEKKEAKERGDDAIVWDEEHERAHLWIIPFCAGHEALPEPRALTGDDRHVTAFDWSEDGEYIAFAYQPTPRVDDWPQARLARVTAHDKEPEIVELARLRSSAPDVTVVGDRVACVTGEEPVTWATVARVVLYPLDGGEPQALHRTPDARPFIVGADEEQENLYVLENAGTGSAISALPLNGDPPRPWLENKGYLSFPSGIRGGRMAMVHQDLHHPNRIVLAAPDVGAWEALPLPRRYHRWNDLPVPCSEVIHWQAPDGTEVEGIVTYPMGMDEESAAAHPTLVIIHGGPAGVFVQNYAGAPGLYPLAALAEQGYAVLRANPRGSSGYGPDFRLANKEDWGGGDYSDIMAGLDGLIERGIADPDRLGVMGWSYGGYMTSWIITQTDRFKAASVGAGVTDLVSMTGTSDITDFLPDYFAHEFWEDPTLYLDRSAMFHVEDVTTPTLIQHGEEDVRVPLSQGKELYNALKRRGVPVRMIIYPRQGHGPNEPRLVMDVMRRNLDWFDRWVPVDDEDDGETESGGDESE